MKQPSFTDQDCIVIIYQNGGHPIRFEIYDKTWYGDIKVRKFVNGKPAGWLALPHKVLKEMYQQVIQRKKQEKITRLIH